MVVHSFVSQHGYVERWTFKANRINKEFQTSQGQ